MAGRGDAPAYLGAEGIEPGTGEVPQIWVVEDGDIHGPLAHGGREECDGASPLTMTGGDASQVVQITGIRGPTFSLRLRDQLGQP